jgi:hypothetical protein
MLAFEHQQPLAGHLPKPKPKGHWPTSQKVGEPAERFEVRFLNDVRWIDAGAHPRIDPRRDDLRQEPAMPSKKPIERSTATLVDGLEQPPRLSRVGTWLGHDSDSPRSAQRRNVSSSTRDSQTMPNPRFR